MTFSLAILHAVNNDRRRRAVRDMLCDLTPLACQVPFRLFDDVMPAGRRWDEWQHELHPRVWQWALDTKATHHVFMTDDLHIAPRFWQILGAMVESKPTSIIGLLSNHPAGQKLSERGFHWYRCNSWIVGPAYVVPRDHMAEFRKWYLTWLPSVNRRNYGDDSSLNEWISTRGPRESWHPIPTIIEHRSDIESTWQSGDQFSRERVSWRSVRSCHDTGKELIWTSTDKRADLDAMAEASFWTGPGPMLNVGGASASEAFGHGQIYDPEAGERMVSFR